MVAPDPRRCSAMSKTTGERCRQFAVAGASVCHYHGGAADQVKRKAAERVTLAEALAAAPHRAPWEVLADVVHGADVVAQAARDEVINGQVTPATLLAFTDALEQAGRWAKTALDAGVDERQVQLAERQGQMLVEALRRIFDRLGLTDAQRALIPQVVPEELRRVAAAEAPRALPGREMR